MRENHGENPGIGTIVLAREKDLGGLSVRRLLPSAQLRSVGPFVFFDHLGPVHFEPGTGLNVKPHPHIGLATVTYLFDGEVLHHDSLGHVQSIQPGAINWMIAGRGIVHSERTPLAVRIHQHTLHALQLWVALPEQDEQTEPDFRHYDAEQIPLVVQGCAAVRVLIGEAFGLQSPVKTYSPTLYLEAALEHGCTLKLPHGVEERAVYVISGAVRTKGTNIEHHHLVTFDPAAEVELTATEKTRLVVLGGQPLGKRTVWWNFVATRRELIEAAKTAWKEGRYPQIPGETDVTPLPED